MTFELDESWVWDFWLADDGALFHMYYLHAPKSLGDPELRHRNATIGHATSTDLFNWKDLGKVLGPGGPDDFDSTATWTGSVVRGWDGLWRMFYTGARFFSNHNIESIGVATSANLHDWTKEAGPVSQADSRWYERYGDSNWPEEAWRDPWVYPDEHGNGWHMLITARANHGPDDNRGVIGHAWSQDLDLWETTAPFSAPGAGFAHLEVPQVFEAGGHTHLLFSCDLQTLSASRQALGQIGGVWSVPASDNSGHFDVAKATLIGGSSIYSGRVARDRSGNNVMLAFVVTDSVGGFAGTITDPIPFTSANAHTGLSVDLCSRDGTQESTI